MRRVALISILILTALFGTYLGYLYRQLEQAFSLQDQFIPTRIYSDVSRIAPPQPRAHIEERLKSLGYTPKKDGTALTFHLHSLDYPDYLIPEGHPTLDAISAQALVKLEFESSHQYAALQSIQLNEQETSDLYLEPELVATLSRSGINEKRQIREYLKFEEIPAQIWQAIIAVEDQHFMDHIGLDPKGFARAVWVNIKSMRLAQGGSTITQQLVKNLMARRTKNLFQKANELFLAVILEIKFEKKQILERYLNEVYLGQIGNLEVHGVAEGAKHFFGKRIDELNLGEIALMAGLIRGPGYYSPYRYRERAMERQRLVLKKMAETGQIAQAESDAAVHLPIGLAPPQTSSNKAPYFVDFVKAELIRQLKERISEQEISQAGFRVYTTLDVPTNVIAQDAVAQGIATLEKNFKTTERIEGALASVDHTTGYIRALIGGRSYAQSTFNRILNMKRQVGSTFKPFVYLAALQKGTDSNGVTYSPAYPVEDASWTLTFDRGKQVWTPRNYEDTFGGWIPLRKGLAHSINTVAARLGWEVGIQNIVNTARGLGIDSELPQVPSLALGVAELSPVELLRAYATLANHGVQDELTVIRGITKDDGAQFARFVSHSQLVSDPAPIDLLTDMMTSVFTEGTAASAARLGLDRAAAGKTGTTSNHRDSWFAGFTPQLTTVVWVGTDQPQATQKSKIRLTGASAALPIWVSYMKRALEGEPPMPFPLSPHLVSVRTDRHTGQLAGPDCPDSQVVIERFIQGREPRSQTCERLWPASRSQSSE